MDVQAYPAQRSDGPLWMAAFALSLILNALLLAFVGIGGLKSLREARQLPAPAPVETEAVATVFAEFTKPPEAAVAQEAAKQRFARTSEDQPQAEHTEKPAFMGERNTVATSDRNPDATAPPLPSQAGIQPEDREDIETTESRYQDGSLTGSEQPSPEAKTEANPAPVTASEPPAMAEPAASPAPTAAAEPLANPGADSQSSMPPPREKLLEGPNPVDINVPKETPAREKPIQPMPEKNPAPKASEDPAPTTRPEVAEAPKPKPSKDPAFKGYQRKTAVIGSISRTGRSALDVEDSPLGRYQAAISRAVEQEWQRNCVRHRDFITPGFLTVRFFVEPSGKVRSVQFVGEMETGEVQKGFTLNSIRNAGIPAMPPALRKEYDKEPLELMFRFYF